MLKDDISFTFLMNGDSFTSSSSSNSLAKDARSESSEKECLLPLFLSKSSLMLTVFLISESPADPPSYF